MLALGVAFFAVVGLVMFMTIPESQGLTEPFWLRADFVPYPDDIARRITAGIIFLGSACSLEAVRRNV
jgi:hypothetical protein